MGGNTSETIQRAMGGVQIATGVAATAMGQPEVGLPIMLGGIQSTASPNPNESPTMAGIGGALNMAGGASGLASAGSPTMPGGGALGGSGDIGAMMDVGGTGMGAGVSQMPLSMTQGGDLAMASPQQNPLQGLNPQMLSGLLGGRNQQAQAAPSPPPPPPIRPPLTLQNASQQMAMPMPQPTPHVPQMNPQAQMMLMRLLGGQGA